MVIFDCNLFINKIGVLFMMQYLNKKYIIIYFVISKLLRTLGLFIRSRFKFFFFLLINI